ncbi:MAG: hypothetical protein AAFP76_11935 [Bacteroidota bacterium]
MKKFKLVIACLTIFAAVYSCTPEDQQRDEFQIDKREVCPPNDENCNGIPDNEE